MINSEKLLESLNNIDDELLERSERNTGKCYITYIAGAAKLLAACVIVFLVSAVIYEANREAILSNRNKEAETVEHTASVIDVQMFDVGLTEDGKITNKYYAIAAAIGKIQYEGSAYRIVTGINIEKSGLGAMLDTYSAQNMRTDLFEGEYIEIKVYELTDMEKDMAVAFSINGEELYYMAVNSSYIQD